MVLTSMGYDVPQHRAVLDWNDRVMAVRLTWIITGVEHVVGIVDELLRQQTKSTTWVDAARPSGQAGADENTRDLMSHPTV
jgi:hypothetical protein